MDTITDPLVLRNPVVNPLSKNSGLLVPFGLRNGRAMAPSEVATGKQCQCVCPGCHAPLMARAQSSKYQRPHFAHLTDTGCQTGLESGIHKRAKQVIMERLELLLPDWVGDMIDMPNPPHARDNEGQMHRGREVDYPAQRVQLQDAEEERWFGSYQPDVYAIDAAGELLIEIRVTHAVDDRKAARVQAHGRRMIEIDLSQLDRNTPHDLAAFDHAVLFEHANRHWISCPDAVADWQVSKHDLDEEIARANALIDQRREQALKTAAMSAEQAKQQAKDKAGRKAYVQKIERAKHANDLAALDELTSPSRIERMLGEYQSQAEDRVSELLNQSTQVVRSACLRAHADAWIYGVDPALWQLLACHHFVVTKPAGFRFNQREVASWVRRSFPYEQALYRLFIAQYHGRSEARKAGFRKRRLSYWIFTEQENEQIPNFYDPVNAYIDCLVAARLIRRLPAPIGECEVLSAPPTGMHPIADIAPEGAHATRRLSISQYATATPRIE